MSLKLIEEIENDYMLGQKPGNAFHASISSYWPLIKEYIDTVEIILDKDNEWFLELNNKFNPLFLDKLAELRKKLNGEKYE